MQPPYLSYIHHQISSQDIESKHIALISEFARDGQNGDSIDLPFGIKVHKEYEYLTIAPLKKKAEAARKRSIKGSSSSSKKLRI